MTAPVNDTIAKRLTGFASTLRCGGSFSSPAMASLLDEAAAVIPIRAVTAAPDGWLLVPMKPTPEMIEAAKLRGPYDDSGAHWGQVYYRAMIGAVPPPPSSPDKDGT